MGVRLLRNGAALGRSLADEVFVVEDDAFEIVAAVA